jgi:phage shock protein C
MQTKRILRSRNDRMLAGVASGLAAYFNIDPLLVRLAFVLLSFINGIGLMLYMVLWALLPNEDSAAADSRAQVRENVEEMRSTAEEMVQRARDMFSNKP